MNISDAIYQLRPGAEWTLDGNEYENLTWLEPEDGQSKPTKEEVLNEVEKLKKAYINNEYQRKRKLKYPSFAEQFDLLYHGGYDAWKQEIDKIKKEYPKAD